MTAKRALVVAERPPLQVLETLSLLGYERAMESLAEEGAPERWPSEWGSRFDGWGPGESTEEQACVR